jgi:hypothetical protein
MTGTPAGVGYTKDIYLQPGDSIRMAIDGLGVLRNTVAKETSWVSVVYQNLGAIMTGIDVLANLVLAN